MKIEKMIAGLFSKTAQKVHNIPADCRAYGGADATPYKLGHRDARHAAVEILTELEEAVLALLREPEEEQAQESTTTKGQAPLFWERADGIPSEVYQVCTESDRWSVRRYKRGQPWFVCCRGEALAKLPPQCTPQEAKIKAESIVRGVELVRSEDARCWKTRGKGVVVKGGLDEDPN